MKIEEILRENKIIIGVVVIFGLVIGFLVWNLSPQEGTKKKEKKEEVASEQLKKIDVNFEVLEKEQFKQLEQIGTIPEYLGQIGKDNPFVK